MGEGDPVHAEYYWRVLCHAGRLVQGLEILLMDMLQVAMTYCVELFICIIVGQALGHAVFNTGQSNNLYLRNKL